MAQDLFKINLFFSFNIISSKVKKKLADLMKKEIYNNNQWASTLNVTEVQEPATFYYLYCQNMNQFMCHTFC